MVEQPEFQSFATTRADALCELLLDEPKSMDELMQITGWDARLTRHTLLQLVAAGRVSCVKTGCGIFRIRRGSGQNEGRRFAKKNRGR